MHEYLPISEARSWAVNQGPDPDGAYLWRWFTPDEGQTGLFYIHWELAAFHHPRKWKIGMF